MYVRTLNTANHDGWQRGERLDGCDAVQVAVQQRVAGADNADEADDDDDEAFVPGTKQTAKTATATGVAVNGGTSSKVGGATVGGAGSALATGRVGWERDLKKVRVNESRGSSGEQE
jgi:hypothetical protein